MSVSATAGMIVEGPSSFTEAAYQPSFIQPGLGVVCYAVTVLALKQIPGKPMQLKGVSIVHNIVLITLSFAMGVGSFLALRERYASEGFDGLFCSQRPATTTLDGSAGWWMMIYYLSKFYEFGDTVILCLKKKETIPLHLYHHAVMVCLTWSWCRYGWFEGSLWCVFVNSWIHVAMYVYYLTATFGYKVWWRRYITRAQIFQFITGFIYVNIYFYQAVTRGCGEMSKILVAVPTHLVNVTFIFLFYLFFKKDGKKQAKKNVD